MAKRDANWVLRQMPLVAGGLGSLVLVLNRLGTTQLTETQARSDVLGVILSAVLILVGLLWQRVQPRSPDAVVLNGTDQFDFDPDLPPAIQTELAWASHLLLTNTVTRAIVAYYDGRIILRRGILPDPQPVTPGAIVQRVLTQNKPVYLVNLALYPGRVEFSYLPENTQGVICQPMGRGVLILGAQAPRSYTQQDEAWIAGLADKLGHSLDQASTPAGTLS